MMKSQLIQRLHVPEKALFVALIILHLVPVWIFPYFPSQDGPTHLNNANVLREYNHPDRSIFREYYVINSNPEPNWTGHLVLAGLMYLLPLLVAEKLYLTGYIILLPLSARFAVRAVDHKNSSLAVLSFPFVFNYLLHKGFYNFSYSLPIFFLVTGYWLKKQEHFRWREGLTLTLLWLTLYFSHIFTVVTTCVAIGLLAFLFTAFDLSNHFRGQSIPFWKRLRSRALIPFIAFIPTLLFALNFMHQKGADSGTTTPMTFQLGRLLTLESLVSYHEFERWLAVTLVFLFAVLTAYAFISKVVHWQWNRWDALLLVSALYVYIYFIAPDKIFGGEFIKHRMILFPYFSLLLWMAGQRWRPYAMRTVQVCATTIAVAFLVMHIRSYAQLNNYLKEYIAAGDHIEPNTTLLPLCFSHQGRDENDQPIAYRVRPFLHAAGIIAAKRRIVEMDNYEGNTNYFPVLFRPDKNPFQHIGAIEMQPPKVDFLSFHEKTGGYVDYVLLWQLRDLQHENTQHILEQLDIGGYERIFISKPTGAAQLYRRSEHLTE